MNTSERFLSNVNPEKDTILDKFDRHSEYLVRIIAPTEITSECYSYAKNFKYAAHLITSYLLETDNTNIAQLDTHFFSLAFLYRHSIELGLKALGLSIYKIREDVKNFLRKLFMICQKFYQLLNKLHPI